MFLKMLFLDILLVLIVSSVGVRASSKNDNVSPKVVSEMYLLDLLPLGQVTDETVAFFRYIHPHLPDLPAPVQNEIARLRLQLGSVISQIIPSNAVRILTPQQILENRHVLLRPTQNLHIYLRQVIMQYLQVPRVQSGVQGGGQGVQRRGQGQGGQRGNNVG